LYIPQTFVENEVFGLFDKYFNNHKTFNKIFGTLGDEWRSHGFVDHIKGFVYFNGKQICVRDNESIAFLAPNETFKIMSYGKLFMEGSSPEFGFVDIELFVNFYTYSQEHLELYMKTGMENKPEINYASPNIHNDDTCCGIFPFDD
jgi:hypothetical protein